MRRLLLVFLLQCICSFIYAADSLEIKAGRLKDLYSRVITAKDAQSKQEYETAFFNEFPENFYELVALYGFENDEPAILYDESVNHIYELYNNIASVNDTTYLAKNIRIAIGGKWDADAVSYFQHGVTQKIIQHKELTICLLNQLQADDVKSFWYFIFDGPHPDNTFRYYPELKEFELIDKKTYSIMMEAYEQVLSDSESHGH